METCCAIADIQVHFRIPPLNQRSDDALNLIYRLLGARGRMILTVAILYRPHGFALPAAIACWRE